MKITKTMIKTISVLLAMIFLISSVSIVGEAATSGSNNTLSIRVKTTDRKKVQSNWSRIYLVQSKGTYAYPIYDKWGNKKATKSGTAYGYYTITCTAISGKGKSKKINTFVKDNIKLSLDSNTTYRITVQFNKKETEKRTKVKSKITWKTYPRWRISSTAGISTCY